MSLKIIVVATLKLLTSEIQTLINSRCHSEMIVVAGVNGENLTTIYTTPGANILISGTRR